MFDLHNRVETERVLSPAACGTTGTGRTGTVLDLQGYSGVEFIIDYGTFTATDATVTITVLEGDATGSLTSVADSDLLGTEALAGLAAQATARTSGTGKNVTKRVGYKGRKRYATVKEVPTVTAAGIIGVVGLLHSPGAMPTPNP